MNDEQFEKLISKIDILIKINASVILNEKSLKEQVLFLNSIGLSLTEIASMVSKKPTDIGQYLYRKKKKSKKKGEKNENK